MDDRDVQEKVRTHLSSNRELDGALIEVRVEAGVVTLSGTVVNAAQRNVVRDAAANATGAREVHVDLQEQP